MTALLAGLTALTSDPVATKLNPLEQAVVATREAIRDAHLVVEVETIDPRTAPHPQRYRYETWYESERQRTEVNPLDEATRTTPGHHPNPYLIRNNCPERGKLLGLLRDGGVAKLSPPGFMNPAGASDKSLWIDLKKYGLVFAQTRTHADYVLHDKVGPSRLPAFVQSEETVGGRRLICHTASPPNRTHKMWIDPDRGPSVVRVEYTGPGEKPEVPVFR